MTHNTVPCIHHFMSLLVFSHKSKRVAAHLAGWARDYVGAVGAGVTTLVRVEHARGGNVDASGGRRLTLATLCRVLAVELVGDVERLGKRVAELVNGSAASRALAVPAAELALTSADVLFEYCGLPWFRNYHSYWRRC